MCTAFVHKGRDVITAFNFDMNVGGMDYVPVIEPGRIGVGMRFPREELAAIPPEAELTGGVRLIQGVSAGGHAAGMLCNMDCDKVPGTLTEGMQTIDWLTDTFVTRRRDASELLRDLSERETVNLPAGMDAMPLHSLFVDPEGRVVLAEPGSGYAVIRERYFAVTNFALLEPPTDLDDARFGYYGVDRWRIARNTLKAAAEDFGPGDALRLLAAVKQTGTWGTRFSFVYSRREDAAYYCLEGDFDHIQKHCFG